ncbi:MAG: TniB family NTP-binding protein [Nostoc sp. DedVER02]|uniref:TniB family NTP-binding protein n=1 Tax=unclassified Nostoc TaxID=2593658 RepID=UPI002AD2CE6C|nr:MULTISPECIES: TniB family NTP-binding protein [unclassified Nostoc]MDZ7985179.1 TniB family NTP-binding protein [Nostoc sp. DedVER02]MDZ8115117.1 TniB family NTP-binding protein [Nostoc sp. DedVER01b]
MTEAQAIAKQLGGVKPDDEWLQAEIARLKGKSIVPLQQVKTLHDWLDGKRKARQSCRVVGESRTGKTVACDAYRYRQKPQQEVGRPPIVPVVYIQPPQKCGSKDLFQEMIEYLKFRATKGTVSDFRGRAMEVLKGCGVEMLIIDEADRLKPETFAEVRDIYDKLGIAVVLVGTDRLEAVIKRDEQVYNRFRACHRFGKLSGKDFQDTVQAWEDRVLRLPVASNLTSKDMLRILTSVTEGYIGRLDEILREAAIRSLSKGFKKIDKAVLQEVAKEYK